MTGVAPTHRVAHWRHLCLVLGAIWPLGAAAQESAPGRPLRGTVRDASSGDAIADATVILPARNGHATTGPTGRFTIHVPARPARMLVTRIGFAPESLVVVAGLDSVTVRLRPSLLTLDPLVVAAEPSLSAASSRAVQELDIHLRPRETAQELLRLAPGLVIAQHAGGGKAEQIFLRGFDADHGTDVAVSVDGVPANMVSHGHGQGYADLHFLIPEIVERGDVRKGPYDAADGNLATAGAVDFRTRDRVSAGSMELRGGSFGTGHLTALVPVGGPRSQTGGYVAAAAHTTDGPVLSAQRARRLNGFAKLTSPVGAAELVVSGSAFGSRWDASGQVPERAVRSGRISRFGSLDDSEGGSTSRADLSLGIRSLQDGGRAWEVRAYAVRSDFELFSNFTFFLADSTNGDGIRQADRRWILGVDARRSSPLRLAGIDGRLSGGIGGRGDWIDVRLDRHARRRLLEPRVDARVRERHGFAWARQDLALASAVRLQLGLRGDLFAFAVNDRLGPSGTRTEAVVSPKANLALQVTPALALYANAGYGFHSNDARSAVAAGGAGHLVVPRAAGLEIGARYAWSGGTIAAAAWRLDLQSELVYVGDEGTTESSGRTRRMGMDVEVRARLLPWLWLDGDLALSRGRFRDEVTGADRIPLAPTLTSTGGLTVRDVGPASGGLRYRYVGSRAANEDNTVKARGYTVVELFGRWAFSRLELVAAVDNLLDVAWNEAQFATTSRLQDEPSPVTELHFTPGAGRSLQVGVGYEF